MSLERIGKGIRYSIILNAVQITATIVFYHIASGVLTKAEIGLTATLAFLYSILTVLSSLALPVAGAKYVAEFLGRGEEEKASATAKSIIKLVIASSAVITSAVYIILISSMFS